MSCAIDTNAYVNFCRGDPSIVSVFQNSAALILPFVVLAELRAGFRAGKHSRENERRLISFLNSSRVEVLYCDESTTFVYAEVFHSLKTSGRPFPTNDLWIASLCIQHNLPLLTNDSHFKSIERLALCVDL